MSFSGLIKSLTTLADNVTPSLRKILAMGIGTLGLAIGVTFIGLSVYSTMTTGTFDPAGFGTGASLLLAALSTLPLSLAKSMELVPDTTVAPTEGGTDDVTS